MMALDAGYRMKTKPAAIVAMSGAINENELPDLRARAEVPVIVVHGSVDDVIPVNAARRTRRVLEEHGVEPEYHEFPMSHQVSQESIAVVAEFVARVLGSR